ncbi:MAG: PEGA domain-containing protein [Deltaproteobacteria bacterium]|nr:PEGA domain-containing protein [Deltaproteobacteria bacterium]
MATLPSLLLPLALAFAAARAPAAASPPAPRAVDKQPTESKPLPAAVHENAVTVIFVSERAEERKFADELMRATAAAFANAGIEFVKPPTRPLNEVMFAVGCSKLDERCAAAIAEGAGARQMVLASALLNPAPTVVYSIIDVASSKRTAVGAVPVARFDAVGAQQVAAALARELGAAARLLVRSQPPGAVVRVDGTLAGETPVELRGLSTGRHAVAVRFPDGAAIEQTALVLAGAETVIDAARDERAVRSGLSPTAIAGWSLIGASVLAAATGGVFGALAAQAQGRYDAERVVNGVTVQDLERAEAKALAREIEAELIGAEAAFATSLALALGSALLFGVAGE